MFWCLVRLSTEALCGGLYANPLEMAIQSAVACSEVKDDGLLVSRQLMQRVLVWVVSFSLAVEDGFLFIMDKSFTEVAVSVLSRTYILTRTLARPSIHTCTDSHALSIQYFVHSLIRYCVL